MIRERRAARWLLVVTFAATSLWACGSNSGDELEAEGPATTRRGRFPSAVVSSTSTPGTTPFGNVAPGGTSTTRPPTPTTRKPSPATSAATTSTSAPPSGRVKPAETPLPVERTGVSGTAWQGLVVVAGGIGSGGGTSVRVDAYDPKTGQWSRGPNLPMPLHDASLAVLGDDLWVVGGFTTEGDQPIAQAATYFFHPGDTEWKTGPTLHTARGGAAAAALGNLLVVLGGQTTDGGILDSVEVLALGGSEWQAVEPLSEARAFASTLAMNDRIYAVGGKTAAASAVKSVESWRTGSSSWRSESRLDSERSAAGGAGRCVAGGENPQVIVKTIECYGTGFWVIQGEMRVARHGLTAVLLDGWLHLIAGANAEAPVTDHHEVIDLQAAS